MKRIKYFFLISLLCLNFLLVACESKEKESSVPTITDEVEIPGAETEFEAE